MDDWSILDGLNPSQREAVAHVDGPLMVLAGPGSGKTRVITHRLAYLMARGIPDRHLLALTFTNKAAEEMRQRVAKMVGRRRIFISTFHSFCARMLRAHAPLAGLQENFSIYDQTESREALKNAIRSTELDVRHVPLGELQQSISRAKRELLTPDEYRQAYGDRADPLVCEVYSAYQEALQRSNVADFDDLLFHIARMLEQYPQLRAELDARFRYVMVDEYQDTNHAQFVIIRSLSSDHPNLMVTGDPDQSIYGWRGATIENMLQFQRHFSNAQVVRLEQNYRSTPNILRVADALISHNQQRLEKKLQTQRSPGVPIRVTRYPTSRDESEAIAIAVATEVAAGRRQPRDFAVFYRANYLSRAIERALRRNEIPYQVVRGVEFYQRKEVKDVLAYLRLIHNPGHDEAFRRIVNVPARGIGKVTLQRLARFAADREITLWDAAHQVDAIDTMGARAKTMLGRFVTQLDGLSKLDGLAVEPMIQSVLERTGYLNWLEGSMSPEDIERTENVNELIADATEFDEGYDAESEEIPPLEAFLQNAALVADQDGLEDRANCVSLMTLHAAKGLEFPFVFIVAVEGGILPHERSYQESETGIEEERRLLFVGVTRAMDELRLSLTTMREGQGRTQVTVPSAFLMELPKEELEMTGMQGGVVDAFGDVADGIEFVPDPSMDELPWVPVKKPSQPQTAAFTGIVTATQMQHGNSDIAALASDTELPLGTVVSHPEYGIGKVVRQDGKGRQTTVDVRFGDADRLRSFRVAYAPLTVLRPGEA